MAARLPFLDRRLIEVPVLIGLVHVALAARRFFPSPATGLPAAAPEGSTRV